MPTGSDDLAEIASNGTIEVRGQSALLRLQAHAGTYRVLPSPEELLLWKRAGASEGRSCLMCGEIPAAGVLCDLLSFVGHSGRRGEFVVHDGSAIRSLFFDAGHVVGAQSTAMRERLGEVLYRYGALDRRQVDACSEALADGGLRFGEVAVKLGFLTRERLFGLMARQPEEIFYALLLATNGTYFFLEGFEDERLASRHKLSLTTLMRDGIRRMHEMRYFRGKVPSERHVPVWLPAPAPPPPDVAAVHAAIDGARDVAEICRFLGQGEFEVTRALFHLVQTGHAEIQPPQLTPEDVVVVCSEAVALILRELDAMDQGDTVREQLAAFAKKPVYDLLFADAGPADDGTLDAERVAANVRGPGAPPDAASKLAGWLHEYASYALFLARPHLRRAAEEKTQKTRLSTRVTEMLHAIAPPTIDRTEKEP